MINGICPCCMQVIAIIKGVEYNPNGYNYYICPYTGNKVRRWNYEEDEVPF